MNELSSGGRCQDWLGYDYWKDTGHFNWEDRCPGWIISPEQILQSVRGKAAYIGFKTNPVEDDKILDFVRDFHRLNLKMEDWTSARCFWPKPGDLIVPYHFYFFGTTKDMMTIRMILDP